MLRRFPLVLFALPCLSACTFHPELTSASVHEISPTQNVVEVTINSDAARRLKAGEFYFSVVTAECDDGSNRFPMEPLIDGTRASEFDFPIREGQTIITSHLPSEILRNYRKPCVYLEGGGYFSGKVRSETVQLLRASAQRRPAS